MAVKKIEIKDFNIFKDFELEFSPGINVFIGENGTGKTQLLKLLYAEDCKRWGYPNKNNYFTGRLQAWYQLFGKEYVNSLNENSIVKIESNDYETVFIPAKEVLSMSSLDRLYRRFKSDIEIDVTIFDIIEKALYNKPDVTPDLALSLSSIIEAEIGGTVVVEKDDSFWLKKESGDTISFLYEAEGFRKLGLLWQLLINESITKDKVLLWDEPESNISPKLLGVLANILLKMSQQGVQIFLTAHSYTFAKYLEIRTQETDNILFHSLMKKDDNVTRESKRYFRNLQNNIIMSADVALLEEAISGNMGE